MHFCWDKLISKFWWENCVVLLDLVKLIVTFKSQMKQKDVRQGMKFGALKLHSSSFFIMFNFSTLPAF